MNQLDQLKKFSTVVADSGDFTQLHQYKPTDATTNPSLILLASQQPQYHHLLQEAVEYGKRKSLVEEGQIAHSIDKVLINFAKEILKVVPGRVSLEIDSRLSFNTTKSIEKAETLIDLLEKENVDRKRILIKLATTWEGIEAAKYLEKNGIHCNMTLIFSLFQAICCGDAKATLISPFVGRILDWHKKKYGIESYLPEEDPGVISVTTVYNYYKKFNYPTQIMGASFRNKDEVLSLAGCDLLTISPKLLEELKSCSDPVSCKLCLNEAKNTPIEQIQIQDQNQFSLELKNNPLAFEKLHEGIQKFSIDTNKLENLLKQMI